MGALAAFAKPSLIYFTAHIRLIRGAITGAARINKLPLVVAIMTPTACYATRCELRAACCAANPRLHTCVDVECGATYSRAGTQRGNFN